MNPTCLLYAPILTIVVGLLKRVSFVGKYPKVVAATIAAAVAVVRSVHPDFGGIDIPGALECIGQLLAGAVATHEIVVKPIANQFAVGLQHSDK